MPSVTQFSEYLVAGHTTGDGLGQNVRIMWMMFNSASNSNDLVMSIKSWETGETLFKQSTPNYSGNNPYSNLQMKIPVGGIFCKGGAVFDFGDSVIASFAISSLSVGYQL